ncbi:MAG: hypothetical protein ACRCS3_08770 [Paracoccaceae bacterium]
MQTALCERRASGYERIGITRATVAVARKLAFIMHAMLKSGQPFQR